MRRALGILALVVMIGGGIWLWQQRSVSAEPPPPGLISALSEPASENFARATVPNDIQFPRDLGAHDDYQTEWWYYTGNLDAADGREFGFQFTIFRRALAPVTESGGQEVSESAWRTEQVYLVHFTISDVANEQFYFSERYARGGAGLAGAVSSPYRVWLEDMEMAEQPDGTVLLTANAETKDGGIPYSLNLSLSQTLPPILHGDGGLSAKSLEAGNASYYYSFVQQAASGTVTLDGEEIAVTGKAWKDHEYSTSVLSEGARGWDWFSLQFDDGTALMLFQIRKEGDEIEPASAGTFINADGSTVDLAVDDWALSVDNRWKSGDTNGNYPSEWTLSIPSVGLELTGEAQMNAQEVLLSTGSYWEGAVDFVGNRDGAAVSAEGYVEMTGYAE